ncbi:hypothetical protein CORC01_00952 [Colletotrichum orchidophilum]|uniref:Uncharacterized protein n=1 Tax=Colletotrichum orchidophilum TaxID=1209926 RepID=A0A1G4BQL7_9PEZI|nr:uncharacterized protein CORC01_00952 [Colletotrichum orchidophilum]OHF03633.1 hypothetical protein CORC01_00952 [Colletotrichum orchidophilum]
MAAKKNRPGKHQRKYHKAKKHREASARWHAAENNAFPDTPSDTNARPMKSKDGHESHRGDTTGSAQGIEEAAPQSRDYRPDAEPQSRPGKHKVRNRLHHFTIHHAEQMMRRQLINERTIRAVWNRVDDFHPTLEQNCYNIEEAISRRIGVIEKSFNLAMQQGGEIQRDIKKNVETTPTMRQDVDSLREAAESHEAEIAKLKSKFAVLDREPEDTHGHTRNLSTLSGQLGGDTKSISDEIKALQCSNKEMQAEMVVMREMIAKLQARD